MAKEEQAPQSQVKKQVRFRPRGWNPRQTTALAEVFEKIAGLTAVWLYVFDEKVDTGWKAELYLDLVRMRLADVEKTVDALELTLEIGSKPETVSKRPSARR